MNIFNSSGGWGEKEEEMEFRASSGPNLTITPPYPTPPQDSLPPPQLSAKI